MKKYIIALLLGISLMAAQSASAASLRLDEQSGGVTANVDGSNGSVNIIGGANLTIDGAASGELFNLMFSFTNTIPTLFNSGTVVPIVNNTASILAGTTYNLFFNGTGTFSISANSAVGEVPLPAAVWLFGSAILGMAGVKRRKSQPTLAA